MGNSALPPHSIDAEQALMGAILLDNSAFHDVAGIVDSSSFFNDGHRRIFRHIAGLMIKGQPADPVTVGDSIERSNEIEEVGGRAYLIELANGAMSSRHADWYAGIVRGYPAYVADQSLLALMEFAGKGLIPVESAAGPPARKARALLPNLATAGMERAAVNSSRRRICLWYAHN